jgi:hypothetical protein
MSTQQKEKVQETSGIRTLINILGFILGTVALLLFLKYLIGM